MHMRKHKRSINVALLKGSLTHALVLFAVRTCCIRAVQAVLAGHVDGSVN